MNPLTHLLKPFRRNPSCQDINRFLAEYLEGSLPSSTRDRFQSHLSKCALCIAYIEQYKATINLVKDQSEIVIPDQLVEHTLEFLRTNRGPA